MVFKFVIMVVAGLAAGVFVAGAMSALIVWLGLFGRVVVRMGLKEHISLLGWAVIAGTMIGNVLSSSNIRPIVKYCLEMGIPWQFNMAFQMVAGLFMGIYVGCFALSLAENLDVLGIGLRKCNIQSGFSILILTLALGKVAGSILSLIVP